MIFVRYITIIFGHYYDQWHPMFLKLKVERSDHAIRIRWKFFFSWSMTKTNYFNAKQGYLFRPGGQFFPLPVFKVPFFFPIFFCIPPWLLKMSTPPPTPTKQGIYLSLLIAKSNSKKSIPIHHFLIIYLHFHLR
jgi:hypothetical protein